MIALRTALKVLLQSLLPDDLAAALALEPQALRADPPLFSFGSALNTGLLP
jgi:hypothetical protein